MSKVNRMLVCTSFIMVVLFVATAVAEQATPVVEISGRVTDESGSAIGSAVVEAVGTDVSAVLTDAEGRYKFYLVGQEGAFTLRVSKEGYRIEPSRPITPRREVRFDAVLSRCAPSVRVMMERFQSGVSISGRVIGLEAEDMGTHKVLVYVLTNQWYIHPFAENKDGTGYASIKKDGSWTIKTVNRRHNPFNVAMVVVPMDYVPPATVASGEDADQSLRARFGAELTAIQIIPAPDGL